ncbi:ATP-binding protein [Hymenobacter endophyticus]
MVRILVCCALLLGGRGTTLAAGVAGKLPKHRLAAAASAMLVQQTSQRRIDSLRALIRARAVLDTTKVILVTRLAWEVQQRDVQAGLPLLRQAVALARTLNYRDYEAETLLDLADGYISLGDYKEAIKWLDKADAEFTRIHNVGGQIRCLGRRARIASQRGQYIKALTYCLKVPPSFDYGDTRRFYTSLQIQIASTYRQLGELGTAEQYLRHALEVSLHHDYPDRLNLIYEELGEVRRQQQRWQQASSYYAQSMVISKQLNLAQEIWRMEINLAEMEEELGQSEAALSRAHPALPQARKVLPVLVPRVLVLLARANLSRHRPDSAAYYAQLSLAASKPARAQADIQAGNEVLAQAYAQLGDFAHAYQAQQAFMVARDSLTGAEVRRRTAALQFRNELSQQQAEIRLLTQQNRLQQQHQQLGRLKQQRQAALLVGLGLGLLLLAGAGLWQYRRRQARREAALRTSLAADLHDDVGSLLTQISLQSTMLREGLYPVEQQRSHLDHMAETSRMAARQMSDVVWGIDARNDSFTSMLDRMHDHAHQVLPPAGLELDFYADPALAASSVSLGTRQALYLIYKEALHNAVKHARATQVTVRLRQQGRQLELVVLDDGQAAPIRPAVGGQGLRNMRARAAAAAGTVTYETQGPGFRVTARLPLG